MASPTSMEPMLSEQQLQACCRLLESAPRDGQGLCMVRASWLYGLMHDAQVARRLHDLVNTPELVDFPKAVQAEAAHQLLRRGTEDREGKAPADWFWLVAHLATRALEHHKEAERIAGNYGSDTTVVVVAQALAHHREKAVHHVITTAAALAHWHAAVLGKHTAMRPSSAAAAATAEGADHAAR